MNKYINLDDLPKRGKLIDWKNSIGCKVDFTYKDVNGYVVICNYENKNVSFNYNNKVYKMYTGSFVECKFGKILNKYNGNFKVEINSLFKDNKKDFIITDRKYRKDKNNIGRKFYKYKCNKCGYDKGWIDESHLLDGQGCACCNGKTVVKGINDIATTDPWMIEYLVNKEDAYRFTSNSGEKIKTKCPDCGSVKTMQITTLYTYGFGCTKCSDGISYPNKFIINLLKQLNVDFKTEYSPEWSKGRRYDSYIPSKNLIIEMDGGLGHGNKIHSKSNITLEESKEIDSWKDEQARLHGIEVIRIDCNYNHENKFEFIKNNLLNGDITNYFDLSSIDWDEINNRSTSNLIKLCCDYYNSNNVRLKDMANFFNIHYTTLLDYLKQGKNLGWCK